MKTVAFTGYRMEKMPFPEDETNEQYIAFQKKLTAVVNRLIERGYTEFISGVAVGFDTWAAETVLSAKILNDNVSLECAIPFPEQDRKWSHADKVRRKKILKSADQNTMVCEYYHKNSFFIRNEYMVDKAEVVVCCFDGQSGGTAQTVGYAKRKDKIIIQINPNDASVSIISRKGFE